jgi:hypothetical protein
MGRRTTTGPRRQMTSEKSDGGSGARGRCLTRRTRSTPRSAPPTAASCRPSARCGWRRSSRRARLALLFLALAISGCANAALYQHPKTGQTQLCQQDTNALLLWGFDTGYTACKDALERAGWQRLP